MSETVTRPSFNIAQAAARKKVLAILDEDSTSEVNIHDFLALDDYMRNGEAPAIVCGDTMIFQSKDSELYLVNKGIIYKHAGGTGTDFDVELNLLARNKLASLKNPAKDYDVIGFIADAEITIGAQTYAKTVLRRGDEEFNDLVSELPDDFPTISLDCMARMFENGNGEKEVAAVAKKIGDGSIVLVDFLPDERKPMTADEKKAAQKSRKQNKPELMPVGKPGFTAMDNEWHRSSTILIRAKAAKGASYIFGQDEGAYFGCQLADHPDDVSGAFESLIPEEIRGMNFQRQGEWFAVPVAEDEVPTLMESVAVLPDGCGLPITDLDSNIHHVYCNGNSATTDTDIRISRDGTIYAKDGYVEHDDHEQLEFVSWVRFVRNTALKSVSAERNVD